MFVYHTTVSNNIKLVSCKTHQQAKAV